MRTRLVLWIDSLILLAVLLTIVIELTGGFHARLGDVRISGRSPDRALFLAIGLIALRAFTVRGTGFLGVPRETWHTRWQRVYNPPALTHSPPLRAAHLFWATGTLCAVGVWLLGAQLREFLHVPDLGDPLFSMWRMAWVFRQLQGDPRPLFDANIYHPEPLTLTYSDAMLLPSLTAAPLLASGISPIAAYNVLFLSGFLVSGLTTFLLVRRLTGSAGAGIVAGVLFAFYPYRFEHYSHLELQMTHWMPLGLLAMHRFLEMRKRRDLVLAAACAIAQLYSSMYYGMFFGLYAAVTGAALARVHGMTARTVFRPIAVGGALALLLALPLARPYLAAQARKGDRDEPAVRAYSATASDYFRAHARSARYGRRLSGGRPERELFPGVIPLVLAAGALVPPVGGVTLVYAAGLMTAFDGSLGMNGLMYPYLYEFFPPMRGLRVPARFSVLVGLSLSVLSGLAVARILRSFTGFRGHLVVCGLVIVAALDLQPTLTLQPVWREPPSVYESLVGVSGAGGADGVRGQVTGLPVLAEFPLPTSSEQFLFNLPYMYFSIWHGLPMVNGYSGFAPPDYEALVARLAAFPDTASVRVLRERGVTHVTLNCALHGPGCEASRAAFARSPALRLIAERAWEGEPVQLFELVDQP